MDTDHTTYSYLSDEFIWPLFYSMEPTNNLYMMEKHEEQNNLY